MGREKQIEILKGAILLEHRGRALYESVAESKAAQPVKELFHMLAKEEATHIEILNRQYAEVAGGGTFSSPEPAAAVGEAVDQTLTRKVMDAITAAGYEAAVISAAIDFEKRAVEYYSKYARSADDEAERKLYQWLADWETGHMTLFAGMDAQLREDIWYDNQFWPMD